METIPPGVEPRRIVHFDIDPKNSKFKTERRSLLYTCSLLTDAVLIMQS